MASSLFVSYAQVDAAWAQWIAHELEQIGYRTILQLWDFDPGSNFILEMDQATDSAERIVAVLSPEFLSSRYTRPEWAAAFARDPLGDERRLVPVRVKPCSPGGLLAGIAYIDLVDADEATARTRLRDGFAPKRLKKAKRPSYPGRSGNSGTKPSFPGRPLLLGNIPHRNLNFTGREELLEALRGRLALGRPAVLTQAISGLGGVGKTELAVEYAYRHAVEYELVWWVRAGDSSLLANDFAGLATYLGLPEKDVLDQREAIAAARRWLEAHDRWLLVLDNADDSGELSPYLPRTSTGHVVITSRSPLWRGPVDAFSVQPFARSESLDFMVKMLGRADPQDLETLAEELGHLPLALDQAASYIQATDITVAEYLELFKKHHVELLKRGFPSIDYPDTVATTWDLSFAKVRAIDPAAADLLNVLAFLGAEAIPKSLLSTDRKDLPEILERIPRDSLSLNDALLALQKYSLITRQSGGYNIHRLVQAVIRDRLGIEEGTRWLRAAAWLVDSAFRFDHDNLEVWETCGALLSHALNLFSFRELDLVDPAIGHLSWQVGLYLAERAEYSEARARLEDALEIYQKLLGAENPQVGSLLSDLGLVVQALGDSRSAHEMFERALAIQISCYGPRHQIVASTLNNLGLVEHALGGFDSARDRFVGALDILRGEFGNLHSSVAVALNNLGAAIHSLGDRESARSYLEEAVILAQAQFPENHPTIAVIRSNLGLFLLELEESAAALEHFETALRIDQEAYGINHPSHATRLGNQALAAVVQGRHDEALVLLENALAVNQGSYADDHPQLSIGFNNHALLLRETRKLNESRSQLEKALEILEKNFGDTHPHLPAILINLGNVCDVLDDLETAKKMLRRAVEASKRIYGPEHAMTARAFNDLGSLWVSLGDEESARRCFERAKRISAGDGAELLERTTILNNLGSTLEALGELSSARKHLTLALSLEQQSLGNGHPRTATTRNNLARILETLGEVQLARENLAQALLTDEAFHGADHPRLILRLNNLATLLHGMGDLGAAWEHALRALRLCEAIREPPGPISKTVLSNLANIAADLGELELAKTYRLQAADCVSEEFPDLFEDHVRVLFVPVLAGIAAGGEISQRVASGNMTGLLLTERRLSTNAQGGLRTIAGASDSDNRLILKIMLGIEREEAFHLLFERHASRVHSFFRRRGLSREDCEDLVQEVFFRVARGIESFRGSARFESWLFEIAANVYRNELRYHAAEKRSGVEVSLDEIVASPRAVEFVTPRVDEPSPEDEALDAERSDLLQEALKELPLQTRQVLLLRFGGSLKFQEIADRMGISITTVKAHLHQARQRLVERLRAQGGF